ncbi:unnamed protein product [Brachionus calyciflorus]|uniref:Protein-tyrosine sulfotransferase n=1 Tax=Brachionus calyciflorus TaxID=104777 RepID=A0A813ND19_9BILA|nr:unnamed protein product [Brachionus calyciflorus]
MKRFSFPEKSSIIILIQAWIIMILFLFWKEPNSNIKEISSEKNQDLFSEDFVNKVLNRSIIFIGGVGRSGTTLMRSILDTHSSIKCGPESPFLAYFIKLWENLNLDKRIMEQTYKRGYKDGFINKALSLFFVYVLENKHIHGNILCEKFPQIMTVSYDLHKKLPNSKFIYMIRDGREVAYSFLNKLNKTKDFENFKIYLDVWNRSNEVFLKNCNRIGNSFCKQVRYIDLVTKTKETMEQICDFLDIEWTDKFLTHNEYIGTDVFAIPDEWSYKQIKKPVNNKSLNSWVGKISGYKEDYVKNLSMLKTFGFLE